MNKPMGSLKRALLFVVRRRGKSVLLFVIFFLMLTLTTAGLSLQSGVAAAVAELKTSLGSTIRMRPVYDESNPDFWVEIEMEHGLGRIYSGPRIDDGLIQKVMNAEGLSGYNTENNVTLWTELKLRPGLYDRVISSVSSGEPSNIDLALSKSPRFIMNDDTARHSYFRSGAFTLKEGDYPLQPNQALISSDIAARNNIAIGDRFEATVRGYQLALGDESIDVVGESIPFQVTGVFDVNFDYSSNETGESSFPQNFIFIHSAMNPVIGGYFADNPLNPPGVYDYVDFFAANPDNIEAVLEDIQNQDINPGHYEIYMDNASYSAASGPLEAIAGYASLLFWVGLIGCMAIIILVLVIWTRNRRAETGILISIGVKKSRVFAQRLYECLLVYLAAFVLAAVLSAPLTGLIHDKIVSDAESEAALTQTSDQKFQVKQNDLDGTEIEIMNAEMGSVSAKAGAAEIAAVFAVGLAVVIFAAGASTASVLRKKPRDLMVLMN